MTGVASGAAGRPCLRSRPAQTAGRRGAVVAGERHPAGVAGHPVERHRVAVRHEQDRCLQVAGTGSAVIVLVHGSLPPWFRRC